MPSNQMRTKISYQPEGYQFSIENPVNKGDITVLCSREPNFSQSNVCYVGAETDFLVDSLEKNRYFFQIKEELTSTSIATRAIELPLSNFRDLGGYETMDGRKVKWGYLYRSGHLHKLTEEQLLFLDRMGLKTVFDLRSQSEVQREPDQLLPDWEYINQPALPNLEDHLKGGPASGTSLDPVDVIKMLVHQPNMKEGMQNFLKEAYRSMAEDSTAFASLFQQLLKRPLDPLVFHCSAGKDRTGISAALILMALGVPKETVMQDYLASNYYRQKENHYLVNKIKEHIKDKELLVLFSSLLGVSESLFNTTFSLIEKKYKNIEAYFEKELALSEKDRLVLQELYLE